MASFEEVTRWGDGPLVVPEDWLQGKAAFGGLQTVAALRALEELADGRPLRSMSVSFVGSTGGRALTARPQLLRAGRSVTQARCDLMADDDVVCSVTAAYGVPRTSVVERRPTRELGDPADAVSMPFMPGIMPNFVQYMDIRYAEGGYPFMGGKGDTHAGWCRHRTDPGSPVAAIVGLLDAWPSPALQQLKGPAPASSVTWTAQFLELPERITVDDFLWFEARVVGAHGDGFVTMRGELYDREGRMLAHLEQLVAVYG